MSFNLPDVMPDMRADDSFQWLHFPEALDTVVDRANIALHQPVPAGQIDSVAEAAVDTSSLMDEFVPHSVFRQFRIVVVGFVVGERRKWQRGSVFANRSTSTTHSDY